MKTPHTFSKSFCFVILTEAQWKTDLMYFLQDEEID